MEDIRKAIRMVEERANELGDSPESDLYLKIAEIDIFGAIWYNNCIDKS